MDDTKILLLSIITFIGLLVLTFLIGLLLYVKIRPYYYRKPSVKEKILTVLKSCVSIEHALRKHLGVNESVSKKRLMRHVNLRILTDEHYYIIAKYIAKQRQKRTYFRKSSKKNH